MAIAAPAAAATLKLTSYGHIRLRPRSKIPAGYRPVLCANERQALFSRIAPVYDNLNDLLSLGQHCVWKRMAVSWSGAKEGNCVLDLCCGSGDLTILLSQKVGSQGKVIGFDFSKEQLFVAASRQGLLWKAFYKNIVWIEGDALDLPYSDCYFNAITVGYGLRNLVPEFPFWISTRAHNSDCYFNAITVGYGLRNLVDRNKAMKGIFRVLKPSARVSILDFNKSSQPYTSMVLEWMIDNVVIPVTSGYGPAEECTYLKSSIREFLTGRELEMLALEAGFSNAKHYEIGGGLMGNLVAML